MFWSDIGKRPHELAFRKPLALRCVAIAMAVAVASTTIARPAAAIYASSPVGVFAATDAVVTEDGQWMAYHSVVPATLVAGPVVLRNVVTGQQWTTQMSDLKIGGFLGAGHELILYKPTQAYRWNGGLLTAVGPTYPVCPGIANVVPSPLGRFVVLELSIDTGYQNCDAVGDANGVTLIDTEDGTARVLTQDSFKGLWAFDGGTVVYDQGSYDIALGTNFPGSSALVDTPGEGYLDEFTTSSRVGMAVYAYDPRHKATPASPFVHYLVLRDYSTGRLYRVPSSDYAAPPLDYVGGMLLRTDYNNNVTNPLGQFTVVDLRTDRTVAVDSQGIDSAHFSGNGRFLVLHKYLGTGANLSSIIEIRRTPLPLPAQAISRVSTDAPAETAAVLGNLAMVDGVTPGYITAAKCTMLTRGTQSSANGNHVVSDAIANLSLIPVDADGSFCIFNQASVNLVADIQGYFAPPAAGGLTFVSIPPSRKLDTRERARSKLGAGSITQVATGAPPGASSVLVNLAMVDGDAPGYITADKCSALTAGSQVRANGNFVRSGAIGNLSVVPIDADGTFCIYNNVPVNLIADMQGYFTSSDLNGVKLDLVNPVRKLDTRIGKTAPSSGSITKVSTGATSGTTAVLVNIAMVDGAAPGYITADKCSALNAGSQQKANGNHLTGAAISNLSVVPIDADGTFCIYNQTTVNLVVDLQGYFGPTGALEFYSITPFRALDTRG